MSLVPHYVKFYTEFGLIREENDQNEHIMVTYTLEYELPRDYQSCAGIGNPTGSMRLFLLDFNSQSMFSLV